MSSSLPSGWLLAAAALLGPSCREVAWISVDTTDTSSDSVQETSGGGENTQEVEPCGLLILDAGPLDTPAVSLQSEWESGACYGIELFNSTSDAIIWSLEVRIGGDSPTAWNALVMQQAASITLRGDPASDGAAIPAGRGFKTGLCMECKPD